MNELEHQLQYPFGDAMPAPGGTMEVAPGGGTDVVLRVPIGRRGRAAQ